MARPLTSDRRDRSRHELNQGTGGSVRAAGTTAALRGGPYRPSDRPARVARVTFEILRAVPIAELEATTRLLRGGRSVELVEASLLAGGAEVMRATALRVRTAEVGLPDGLVPGPRLPGPEAGRLVPFLPTGQEVGYHTAMEFRSDSRSWSGPATVWGGCATRWWPGGASPLPGAGRGRAARGSAPPSLPGLAFNTDLTVTCRPPAGHWSP